MESNSRNDSVADSPGECLPSFSSPIKPSTRATTRSQSRSALFDQIGTPEKPTDRPRFPRGPGVAYSLKQVKKSASALGLQAVQTESKDESHSCGAREVKKSASALELQAVQTESKDESHSCGARDEIKPDKKEKTGDGFVFDDSPLKRLKKKATPVVKIPEKYARLGQFFKCMETSVRLLRLKGQITTFSNISPKVEYLTDRRFSYCHLAQLKYILPEAILVKKVLSRDEVTCCMKPDLQIILVVDAFGDRSKQKQESGYSFLGKIFRARLEEFHKEHPEVNDVPEDVLPEPFNYVKQNPFPKKTADFSQPSTSPPSQSDSDPENQFAVPSHVSGSFKRRFFQEKKTLLLSIMEFSKKEEPVFVVSSPIKCTMKPPIGQKPLPFSPKNQLPLISLSVSLDDDDSTNESSLLDGTPKKVLSTPARIMTLTPELSIPKRSSTRTDDALTPIRKRVRRPLSLAPMKIADARDEGVHETEMDESEDSVLSFLPKSLLRSVKEKEKKALEDQKEGVSEKRKKQKMIACLPKLFDIIRLIFQSSNRSFLTKQELVQKVIISHFDVVDKSEIEDQLNLLEELVPEWLSKRTTISGDSILCVDKKISPELTRQKLAVAQ